MAFEAQMYHGEPDGFMDYTPGSAIPAGTVVVLGGATGLGCGIAHLDIPAQWTGALATGGATYKVLADGVLALGAVAYWNNTTKRVTATATANAKFGVVEGASTGVDTYAVVKHRPEMGP